MDNLYARLADALQSDWRSRARPEQLPPPGDDWSIWLLLGGRGMGKTLSAAQHIRQIADSGKVSHIGLVGQTSAAIRDIMVLGPSGIMSIVPNHDRPIHEPSKSLVTWNNGTKLHLFSAEEPERLRGPNLGYAWVDELCSWANLQNVWDMLSMCLRVGPNPRTVISTTPKPSKLLKSLIAREGKDVVITRGTTYDNRANLAPGFFSSVVSRYEGTRLGRQELNADILEDIEGALWNHDRIDATRLPLSAKDNAWFRRVVVAVDPAMTAGEESDETGIIVSAIGEDDRGYILEDCSGRYSPREWAEKTIAAYRRNQADRIVIDVNAGGDMAENTLRMIDRSVPITRIHAKRGKLTRAEPVAALYEQGRISHVGMFPELEDEMCSFAPGLQGNGHDDRVDALVYSLSDLMVRRAAPLLVFG
jgi:predicted phage terminase large subunit-like protein